MRVNMPMIGWITHWTAVENLRSRLRHIDSAAGENVIREELYYLRE